MLSLRKIGFVALLTGFWTVRSCAQTWPTIPAQMVVTEEPGYAGGAPEINRDDVIVYQGRQRDPVVDWFALRGDKARLELFVLFDDTLNPGLSSQLDEIWQFIVTQSASTAIGIGYMRDGRVDITQKFTTDHIRAADSIRLPMGDPGALASPYLSLESLIAHWPSMPPQEPLMDRWPDVPIRHEVLMITDGIDFAEDGPVDPYARHASDIAQRAGVIVYAIYAAGAASYREGSWHSSWEQRFLARVAERTGGHFYSIGYKTRPSFEPYLKDVARRLNNQYLLAFLARPGARDGLQRIRVGTVLTNAKLIAPENVWVPGELWSSSLAFETRRDAARTLSCAPSEARVGEAIEEDCGSTIPAPIEPNRERARPNADAKSLANSSLREPTAVAI